MENLVALLKTAYTGKRVLVTGHNGFKGSWLIALLSHLGADTHGISLEIQENSPFTEFHKQGVHKSHVIDIRNYEMLKKKIKLIDPEITFHLAAQPLVLESYKSPKDTFEINVQGTVNLLDIVTESDCLGVVVATTDKVYKNDDSGKFFNETDELWGRDPYSLSKTGAEIAVQAWQNLPRPVRQSFVTVRAGNVYGAGDRSADRLFPDLLQSISTKTTAIIRNPDSVRPWQYVLDPLLGYLLIGAKILNKSCLSSSYNFGPNEDSILSVSDFVNTLQRIRNFDYKIHFQADSLETRILRLDSTRALKELDWRPITSLDDGIRHSLELEASKLSIEACSKHVERYLLGADYFLVQ